jgi:hypothetical protein
MTMELFHHPVAVHAAVLGMVEDVNLPEREQKFPDDGIAHGDE